MGSISRRGLIGTVASLATCQALTGCGLRGCDREGTDGTDGDEATGGAPSPKGLVVVFSRTGNTKGVAEEIGKVLGLAVWDIRPEKAYPEDYDECSDMAHEERNKDMERPYVGDVPDWDRHETVFLGYPIWWGDIPQVVKTFIRAHSWDGKVLVPFCTSQSSGWAMSWDNIHMMCGPAEIREGLAMLEEDLPDRHGVVTEWLGEAGYAVVPDDDGKDA